MSNYMYNRDWRLAQEELDVLTAGDFEVQAKDAQFDRSAVQRDIFCLYIRYIVLANKLEEIYDQLVQPQKRILVRSILDSCLGRVVELKHDLVGVDIAEFSYNAEIVDRLGLTALDIESKVPKYFRRDRQEEIAGRRKFIEDIYLRMGWHDDEVAEEKMTEVRAIKIIQMHERARQGRLR